MAANPVEIRSCSPLTPALREFIARTLVPMMLKDAAKQAKPRKLEIVKGN